MTQPELQFTPSPTNPPEILTARVRQMQLDLACDGGWLHAKWFHTRHGWTDRQCRLIASASEGRIQSGSDGYILTINNTLQGFNQSNGRIYSQGKNMLRRAIQERRVYHSHGRK